LYDDQFLKKHTPKIPEALFEMKAIFLGIAKSKTEEMDLETTNGKKFKMFQVIFLGSNYPSQP